VNNYFLDHREPDGTEGVNALKRHISSTGTDPIHVRKAQTAAGYFSCACGLNQILGEDFRKCVEWPFRVGKRWRSADPHRLPLVAEASPANPDHQGLHFLIAGVLVGTRVPKLSDHRPVGAAEQIVLWFVVQHLSKSDEVQTQTPRFGVVDEPARPLQFLDQWPSYGDAARAAEHLQIGLRRDPGRLSIRLGSGLAQKVMAEILYRRIASRTRVAKGADIESGNLPGDDPGAGPARRARHGQLRVGSRRLLLRTEELELRNPA
jgi:hypothetical protein